MPTSSRALSTQVGNTAKRAAKIAGRVSSHKLAIKKIVATQAAFQAAKAIGQELDDALSCPE